MSYDVHFSCTHCGLSTDHCLNYTYNLGHMFQWAIGGSKGLRGLDGMTAEDAIPLLRDAIAKCEADDDLSRFDAPNGWGHGDTALEFLRNILKAALENPSLTIRVS